MKMKTTQSQIEAKIQEIREDADEPSNFFLSNKSNQDDLEWFVKELKNTKIIYFIFYILAIMGIIYTTSCLIFLKFHIIIFPELTSFSVLGYILSLSLLIVHYNRFRFKMEKLKHAIYLINLKKNSEENY